MQRLKLSDTISLFLVEQAMNYQQVVRALREMGYDAYLGKNTIPHLFNGQHGLALPGDSRYIMGLAEVSRMSPTAFSCGTILRYFPVLYQVTRGDDIGYHVGESCICDSGETDNFFNNYIVAIEKPSSR